MSGALDSPAAGPHPAGMSAPPSDPAVVGLVLAGGAGRRMGGVDKALLDLGGRPLASCAADALRPACGAVALSANGDPARFRPLGLPVLADRTPGLGPLGGVAAGLAWAAGRGAAWMATLPTDAPLVGADAVRRLIDACREGAPGAYAAAPDGPHWTVAVWPASALASVEEALGACRLRVGPVLEALSAVPVAFDDAGRFANLNRPEDLAAAREALRARR
jgi:molybdopterin-guanine dinucleotide biosynthesis protein A